jgi:ubiquitin-conjugating enzyme E2 J1
MFEWHFTIRGAPDTDFAGGVYHGRILLPPEYPFKPPNIVFLTPSGRFETNTKVCLSFSSFHPELWQPAWGIRLILEALISFLPTPADGAIGALDWTKEERQKLARESVKFRCPVCCAQGMTCVALLPDVKPKKEGSGEKKTKFHEEIEKLKMFQFQNHAVEDDEKAGDSASNKKVMTQKLTSETSEEEFKGPSSDHSDLTGTPESHVIKDTSLAKQAEKINTEVSISDDVDHELSTGSTQLQVAASDTTNNGGAHPGAIAHAPLVSDHFLNGMIAALAVVVIVLLRQAQTLVDELRRFEN